MAWGTAHKEQATHIQMTAPEKRRRLYSAAQNAQHTLHTCSKGSQENLTVSGCSAVQVIALIVLHQSAGRKEYSAAPGMHSAGQLPALFYPIVCKVRFLPHNLAIVIFLVMTQATRLC